jgi:hypothetical protein
MRLLNRESGRSNGAISKTAFDRLRLHRMRTFQMRPHLFHRPTPETISAVQERQSERFDSNVRKGHAAGMSLQSDEAGVGVDAWRIAASRVGVASHEARR